ncbi:probable glutamine--tRNA ligase [Drosophila sulfurigaster albostrigata]|uniref:probable glutamine--tRNA ligase n=1 Tax=Drosophila sulfurigaster albostrigata TaxID=89887 RepID=UPI002D21E602|nr:probable glutamine--tRNA ligase [Drosophila sulfurigaster albostrigata]
MAGEDLIVQFQQLGMSEQKAKETLKNANVTKNLQLALAETKLPLPDGAGMLLYHMASKLKPQIAGQLPLLVKYIVERKLDNTQRVDAALEYLLKLGQKKNTTVDVAELERECGVGVVVTPEEIERIVQQKIKGSYKEILLEQRYHFNSFKIMQEVRNELKWADAKSLKSAIDVEIFDLLGPKTEGDLKPLPKQTDKQPKANAKAEVKTVAATETDGANTIAELMKTKVHFHAPGENYKTDGYVVTEHTEQLLRDHLKATGGRVQTRFPPEPNGILHIGHAKAININFGYAAAHDGACYLRYDDTNPEKEEEKFFIAIREMVEWLGYKPCKITYSSDNFQQLYDWAVVLIKKNLAYVCHQKADELKGFNPPPSPWRERPIEESLILFEDMRRGKIDEGAATLRLKLTLEEGKVDPVAYRIKFIAHHRTGAAWCIYPTYDYTHCLCDSIEQITHSLCTKEFQSRRSSYYWLCNALNIYCPVQWEYGRLNMNYALVSKRKIAKLITEHIVHDWDDPRLFTLTALRRRGFPAEAINNFCAQMGVTGAQISVDPAMLEAAVRDVLNVSAPRRLIVLEPLKVTISNYPHKAAVELEVPNFPQNPELGTHKITLDRVLYIERSDFKEEPEKGYRRLSPQQSVGLRHAGLVISVEQVVRDPVTGDIVELICSSKSAEEAEKPKAFVQWVSQPIQLEVRLYEQLFKHKNPEDPNEVPGGFLSDISADSMSVLCAYADRSLKGVKVYDKFQFERIGFFSVDPDTNGSHIVFNRTVGLKEDAGKK